MKARLKEKTFYKFSGDARKVLESHVGELIDVETEHLFNNQYNVTIAGVGIRLMDDDISEIIDDVRDGLITCNYCGKQFKSMTEYEKHLADNENNAFKNCDNCFYNRASIIDSKHESEKETLENGDIIETKKTIYTWHKVCTYTDHKSNTCPACSKNACKFYGYHKMTKENTYFLKYPKGYDYYLTNLDISDAYKEKGFTLCDMDVKNDLLFFRKYNIVGSYNLYVVTDYAGNIQNVSFENTRKCFELSAETIKDFFNAHVCTSYYFEHANKTIFENFPKTLKNDLFKVLTTYCNAYRNNETIKNKFFNSFKE